MKVKVLPSAKRDLLDGYRFYEEQAPGIGDYFLTTLLAEIKSLRVNAGIHPVPIPNYHRLLSRHFPFAIYYEMENKVAVVHAVLDCRRDPAWIKRKLDDF